jgi:predicted DNA-binding transcriptional regulator YafY
MQSRLISCLQLLQGERRLTARYLAEQLGVSMRTVYRDIEALCEGGVPIHMERGPSGGIVLADGYRRAVAQFTSDELQAIFASGSGPMNDLGMGSHRAALLKLAGALPEGQRQAATTARQRLLVDHNRWSRGEQPTAILAQVRRAIDAQRCIRFAYRDRDGTATQRVVEPLGLVAKAGVWYVIASETGKGYRTFRAERVLGVEQLTKAFVRPADFDLETYWNSSVASVERKPASGYAVVVRARGDARHRFAAYWGPKITLHDDESATLHVTFSSREAAVAEMIAFDHALEVISPDDLIDAIVAYAQTVLARYANRRTSAPEGSALASHSTPGETSS